MELVATQVKDIEIPQKRFITQKKDLSFQNIEALFSNQGAYEIDMLSDIIHEPPVTEFTLRSSELLQAYTNHYINWVEQTDRLLNLLKNGNKVKFDDLLTTAKDMLLCYTKAPFYVLNLTNKRIRGSNDLYLGYHSVNVAILSMAMAIQAEYGSYQILEIIAGALLHDVGHKNTPPEILDREILGTHELEEYNSHIQCGFEMLKKIDSLPYSSALIVLQHHEYHDGSSTNSISPASAIHPFSSIVHIADAFETRCRFHTPNKAMAFFIQDAKLGFFNKKFVSLFVSTLSLFPIGSYVLTSRDEICKVVGTRRGALQNPIIISIFKIDGGKLLPLANKQFYNTNQQDQVAIRKTFHNSQLNSKSNLGFES